MVCLLFVSWFVWFVVKVLNGILTMARKFKRGGARALKVNGRICTVFPHVLSKATGRDEIPVTLLKNCVSSISKSLCVLLNKVWLLANFPMNGNCRTLYQSRRNVRVTK